MRQSRENQLPLTPLWPDHQHAQELREISKILDENSKLNERVWQDLSEADSTKGAPGMSGEQVLRCGVIKQMHQFSYDRLAFHLADSVSLRAFCRLPLGWTPARSTLAENLSRIRHSTRFPAAFANQIGVLLENGNHLVAGRDRFPPQNTTLGLIDHSMGQFQVVFE